MNLKAIHYNNNLLYLAAIENNIDMVKSLFYKGYPKPLSEVPSKIKKIGNNEDFKKINASYHYATFSLIEDLIKQPDSLETLKIYLDLLSEGNKINRLSKEYQSLCSLAFFYGNIQAFELLCTLFGKEKVCNPKSLLWYIHQAKRNKYSTKKTKIEIVKYIESLGLDWSQANYCLIRWANVHRNITDFKYFYKNRKNGLKDNPNRDKIIRSELKCSIESFITWSQDIANNLKEPVLEYIAERKEFQKNNPYEGYFIILRKCFKVANYYDVNHSIITQYFYSLVDRKPDIIKHLIKSKVRVPELDSVIEKIHLKEHLIHGLNKPQYKKQINKI